MAGSPVMRATSAISSVTTGSTMKASTPCSRATLAGQHRAQVAGMLAVPGLLQIVDHFVGHFVNAALQGAEQPAASGHSG